MYFAYKSIAQELPQDLHALREPPSKSSQLFSVDGELIGEFFSQKRIVASIEDIPLHVQQAFVSAEDGRFWTHPGFDLMGIARAAISNYRGQGSQQGASTITQQLTRMLLLSNERTYYRKMKELLLARRVESELSKERILEMYLNRVYLGNGNYGVRSAAHNYFGKEVEELSIAEAALLAGLVQRPSEYSPRKNLNLAKRRQEYVLERMQIDGFLSVEEQDAAQSEAVVLVESDRPINHLAAPYFVEHLRKWCERRYGSDNTLQGGLRIHTTLDFKMQRAAEQALRQGLEDLDRRIGFQGPMEHLSAEQQKEFVESSPMLLLPNGERVSVEGHASLWEGQRYIGIITSISKKKISISIGSKSVPLAPKDSSTILRWEGPEASAQSTLSPGRVSPPLPPQKQIAVGDIIPVRIALDSKQEKIAELAQTPQVQASFVAIEPESGAVRALVGGYDFQQSVFNRAIQARRQIGSAFKPIIYATAMSQGVTQLDMVSDSPVAVRTAGGIWSPKNYDGKYLGSVTLRTALAKSLNTISVRLSQKVGVDAIIRTAKSLGIYSPLPRHISIALGTPDISLIEIVSAYAALANGGRPMPTQNRGRLVPGRFVDRVLDDTGTLIENFTERKPSKAGISPQLAYLVTDLMKGVVERGTGRKAQILGRPVAGKTGTSTQWRDAWFVGFTPQLAAGVWVGRDDFTPIGARATGGSAALPIWLNFMQQAHPREKRDFKVPSEILWVRANEITGKAAAPGAKAARLVPFLAGSLPSSFLAARHEHLQFQP